VCARLLIAMHPRRGLWRCMRGSLKCSLGSRARPPAELLPNAVSAGLLRFPLPPPPLHSSPRDPTLRRPQDTLLGLLAACSSELSTLQYASRVLGADGSAVLTLGYRRCVQPLPVRDMAGEEARPGAHRPA
jgi:hypothetical protein